MTYTLIDQALNWGLICHEDIQGNWQISPHQSTTRWKLQQATDKWILIVGDVPQVYLHPYEAVSFLEGRLASRNELYTRSTAKVG